jgi:hypothetical protein
MKTDIGLGGINLAELNRRIRIEIYLSGSTKTKWTQLDSNPVFRCERLAALRLSHGENGTKVLEVNPVSVPSCPLQFPGGLISNRKRALSIRH